MANPSPCTTLGGQSPKSNCPPYQRVYPAKPVTFCCRSRGPPSLSFIKACLPLCLQVHMTLHGTRSPPGP